MPSKLTATGRAIQSINCTRRLFRAGRPGTMRPRCSRGIVPLWLATGGSTVRLRLTEANEPLLESSCYQFCPRGDVQLGEDVGQVALDSAVAYTQVMGNLAVCPTFGYATHHIKL